MASSQPNEDGSGSESEWEYEYHLTETETFYVTLDISGAKSDELGTLKNIGGRATAGDSTYSNKAAALNGDDGAVRPPTSPDSSSDFGMQVLDLASRNPFVSYNGQVYSCSWARTLGTDLILARPDIELPFEALYSNPTFQMAANSTTRLIGSAAKLIPKDPFGTLATSAPSTGSSAPSAKAVPCISIPLPPTSTDDRCKQAAFLERIAAAKLARGDTDEVFIAKARRYADFPVKIATADGGASDERQSAATRGRRGGRARRRDRMGGIERLVDRKGNREKLHHGLIATPRASMIPPSSMRPRDPADDTSPSFLGAAGDSNPQDTAASTARAGIGQIELDNMAGRENDMVGERTEPALDLEMQDSESM